MPVLTVETTMEIQAVDLTRRAEEVLSKVGLIEGALLVYCPHTTAGVTVNEHADPDVMDDLRTILCGLVPPGRYRHAEGNSHAHALATMTGSSVVVPVAGGKLRLGTWQGIFLFEFDGPRNRSVAFQPLAGFTGTG